MSEMKENQNDICVCGDFRNSHRDGRGPCEFNDYPLGGHGGGGGCYQFVLAETEHNHE